MSDVQLNPISIILNRFFVKKLTKSDLTVYEYICKFKDNPELRKEQQAIASI